MIDVLILLMLGIIIWILIRIDGHLIDFWNKMYVAKDDSPTIASDVKDFDYHA